MRESKASAVKHLFWFVEAKETARLLEAHAMEEVREIGRAFGVDDIHLIKPSIGEATRVLLRRAPWKILVSDRTDQARLGHLFQLAREKGVPVEEYPLRHYRACGIIRKMADT